MTEFGDILNSPASEETKDSLALYRAMHEMLDAPVAASVVGGTFPLLVSEGARELWPENTVTPKRFTYHQHEGDGVPRTGKALTFWIQTEYDSAKERPAVEAKAFGRMQAFALALGHRYGIPVTATQLVPPNTPSQGPGLMGIALVADAPYKTKLKQMHDDICTAHSYCGEPSPSMEAANSVLCHFPKHRPTPQIDALRDSAHAMDYTNHLDVDQSNIVIADYIRDKQGAIETVHTDRHGIVKMRRPVAARGLMAAAPYMRITTSQDEPGQRRFNDTSGLVIWFDPMQRPAMRKLDYDSPNELETGTHEEWLFLRALHDRFRIPIIASPVFMSPDPDHPEQPTYGLMLRTEAKHEDILLTDVHKALKDGMKHQAEWQKDDAKIRPPHSPSAAR